MLMRREIFKIKPRRDLFEDEVVRLRALELERLLRRHSGLCRYPISRAERKIPFQRHRIAFDLGFESLRHRRDGNPARNVLRGNFRSELLGKLNDDPPPGDTVAFSSDARDRERLNDADQNFFPRR